MKKTKKKKKKKKRGRREEEKEEEEGEDAESQRESWAERRRKKDSREKISKKPKSIPAGLHIPAETGRHGRNRLKFWPRWNMGVPHTGLHVGTRFSVRSGRNGTEYTILWKHDIVSHT